MQPIVLLIIGLGIFEYIQQGKKFLKTYTVKFLDGKFDFQKSYQTGLKYLYVKIRIQVGNETNFVGTLNDAKIFVSWEKKEIGFVDIKNAVTIVAKDITVIELPIKIETINLFQSLPDMFQLISSNKNLIFGIKGKLNFAAGTYDVNTNFKVPLK